MKRSFLLFLILLAFALRVHQLDAFSFWQDEGLTPLRASYSIPTILSNEVTIQGGVSRDTHPPLYFLLIHFSKGLLGESDFAYRYPSVLAGVLLIPLLYQFGVSLASRKVGLVAVLLATLNPLFIWFSQEARMYTLLILFATAASYTLWRGLKGGRILRWLLLYILFAALAFLTHYTAAILIASQSLFWLYLLWKAGHRLLIFAAASLGLLVLIPFIPYTIPRLFTGAETNYFYVSPLIMLQDVIHGFGMGNTSQFSQLGIRLLDIFVAAMVITGFYSAYRVSKGWLLPTYLLVYLLAVVFGLALGSLIKPMYQGVRHIIVGSSAFILLLAMGVFTLPKRPRWLPYTALALLFLGPLISINNLYNNSRYAKDDVRGLIAYIEERAGSRDIVLYNNAILLALHEHYQERADLPATALPVYPFPAGEATISEVMELSAQYDRIWFVNDPPADGRDNSALVESWLNENLLLIDRENKHARTIKVQVDAYSTSPILYASLPEEANTVENADGSNNQLLGWSSGFDQPGSLPYLWFDLYWDHPGPVSENEQLRFLLRDQQGQIWLELNRPFWTWDQQLNSRLERGLESEQLLMRLSYNLRVTDGTPPGQYDLSLLRWDKESGQPTGDPLALGAIDLGSAADWPLAQDLQTDTAGSLIFENGYTLAGLANTDAIVRPGHSLPMFLFWETSSPPPDVTYEMELVGPEGALWDKYASSPGPNWLPAEAWDGRAPVGEIIGLSFPAESPSGRYTLRWRLLENGESIPGRPSWRPWSTEWVNFGSIELHPWPLVTDTPDVQSIVKARLGSDIILYGYDLGEDQVKSGDALELTLYWQAENQPVEDLLTFVHLISPGDGDIVSQVDRIPSDWLRPTAGWRPGEFIVDHYKLAIPVDLPPGQYSLFTGMFDADTFIRPPLFIGEDRQPDDRYQLPSITVKGSP